MGFWEGGSGREWEERWVKHYASFHRILLVGEGDFSFALCLALSFRSASNMVATSLDSYGDLIIKYKRGLWNLKQLQRFGATLIFGVDATEMKYHTHLANCRFDRIVYNFPHAGFHGKEDDPQLIRMHMVLVDGFFRNAAEMLQPYGEVHVSHKTTKPFCDWNIEELAIRNSLKLRDRVDFNRDDYPGYDNKRGDGFKADDPFPLGECCTYKFVLDSMMNKMIYDVIQHNLRPEHSSHGFFRFNICGFAMGDPGLAGCAVVLMDEYGVCRFMFSAPLGVLEYEVAELRAFEAALRFMRSKLTGRESVLIRSNSFVAVSWINYPRNRPRHLLKHFIEIDSMLNTAYGVRIEFIRREDNLMAESFAKKAILLSRSSEAEL